MKGSRKAPGKYFRPRSAGCDVFYRDNGPEGNRTLTEMAVTTLGANQDPARLWRRPVLLDGPFPLPRRISVIFFPSFFLVVFAVPIVALGNKLVGEIK